ncbi:ribonucleoside-diphosphate reductase [Sinimarinibacterium sp. CAU 1509]|uniref:ribonucleoside-diphosphate reductase n=1 Tax=Sinimarinibacterium sp. CAU 1509 TaxID=2562283 RepID=UPI0010AC6E9F|nr:ribonucleoside-diphosphate reductase [Sinimarinibacterium sp. CAU 1509]TJY57387.1 ribonucleoside-diphosphate reductase [Sinimarinibacterium sp. CAU 1509]
MGTQDIISIDRKIVGFAVVKEEPAAPTLPDVDPRSLRIDKREGGSWESTTLKLELTTSAGPRAIYVVIGYGRVCGRSNGREVCIERPLEFFVPANQSSTEHQWVSATMRTLSLAARGGFAAKALADLRKVTWDRGPIWYGKNAAGKTLTHESEVAAIAWAIQNELRKRRYLDENFEERPLDEMVAHFERVRAYRDALAYDSPSPLVIAAPSVSRLDAAPAAAHQMAQGRPVVGTCPDPNCQGDMILLDGCPTCTSCSYSKCT